MWRIFVSMKQKSRITKNKKTHKGCYFKYCDILPDKTLSQISKKVKMIMKKLTDVSHGTVSFIFLNINHNNKRSINHGKMRKGTVIGVFQQE